MTVVRQASREWRAVVEGVTRPAGGKLKLCREEPQLVRKGVTRQLFCEIAYLAVEGVYVAPSLDDSLFFPGEVDGHIGKKKPALLYT